MTAMTRAQKKSDPDNQVFLRGRLAAEPVHRELPSGDVLAVFRLTVKRPPGERAKVDSIECTTAQPRLHRTLERLNPGDEVAITGSLHRRFWRGPAGPASRYAVEASAVRLVSRAGRPAAASRGRTQASA
jgi:single-strand DNA-binding protein